MKIRTRGQLKKYLSEEIGNGHFLYLKSLLFFRYTHQYLIVLRRLEYYMNTDGPLHKILRLFFSIRLKQLSVKTGITISPNSIQEGLTLYHHVSIVVNGACRIGRNCCIMNNVNIGANKGSKKAPIIGDNVYIGPGAVIYGDIEIADGCYIGANSVVNKSFLEPNSVIVGIPAKVLKKDSICWWERNNLNRKK